MLLLSCAACLGGCSSSGDETVEITAGEYPRAFEATRESLREFEFRLDRVDAASGVITTAVKPTSGLATPWDSQQSGIDQEWEDFINRQRRTVRVSFAPAPADESASKPMPPRDPASAKAPELVDLRDYAGPVVATVSVSVERVQRPGWQVSTKSINNSTFTMDPALAAAGKYPTYAVELEPDTRLARRIADHIRAILAKPSAETVTQATLPEPASR